MQKNGTVYLTYTPVGYIMTIDVYPVRVFDCKEDASMEDIKELETQINEKYRKCAHVDICTSEKKYNRDGSAKKKLLNRLARIEGQIRGLEKMVDEDKYCIDVLTQSSAITSAMNSFNKEVLMNHIRNCVTANIKAGNDEIVEEMLDILQKLMK